MTRDRDFKREVRARMRATGERYTQARSALHEPSVGTPAVGSGPDPERRPTVNNELLDTLDRDGFAVVRNVLPAQLVDDLRHWVDRKVEDELKWRLEEVERRRDVGETDVRAFPRGSEGQLGFSLKGDPRRELLVNALADIADVIGLPLRTGGGIESTLPGWGGHSGLHQDLDGPAPSIKEWDGAIFSVPLTGAWDGMRIVPGSHRRDPVFREAFAGAIAPHPDEVHIEAEPGYVVINSIHAWKSGTLNRSALRRSEIWLAFRRDESVDHKIAAYWAAAEISDGGAPLDPGNFARRDS
jgi:hypothetical protein